MAQNSAAKPPQIETSTNRRDNLWLEVVEFLKSNNFDQYVDTFQREGFDRMDALFDINMDDLRDMKIKRGHAKILLYQIEQYKLARNIDTPNKKVRFGLCFYIRFNLHSIVSSHSLSNIIFVVFLQYTISIC